MIDTTNSNPLYPNLEDTTLPSAPPYEEEAATRASVTFHYKSFDDTLEEYKRMTAGALGIAALVSVAGGVIALISIFAGFAFMAGAPDMIVDQKKQTTNFTFPLVTIGTMVALYQTDTMREIMNATVAKMPGMWDWDKMSNTTHEFLTFNVMITLSILSGLVAQGLVYGAIEAKDAHSRNKMRMQ